jgi:hypothetical protein
MTAGRAANYFARKDWRKPVTRWQSVGNSQFNIGTASAFPARHRAPGKALTS